MDISNLESQKNLDIIYNELLKEQIPITKYQMRSTLRQFLKWLEFVQKL